MANAFFTSEGNLVEWCFLAVSKKNLLESPLLDSTCVFSTNLLPPSSVQLRKRCNELSAAFEALEKVRKERDALAKHLEAERAEKAV